MTLGEKAAAEIMRLRELVALLRKENAVKDDEVARLRAEIRHMNRMQL